MYTTNLTNFTTNFNLNISEQDVMDQINILDLNKAYGPNSIPPRLIKEGGRDMTKLLARLFNMSLQQCEFPKIWKSANVYLCTRNIIET